MKILWPIGVEVNHATYLMSMVWIQEVGLLDCVCGPDGGYVYQAGSTEEVNSIRSAN